MLKQYIKKTGETILAIILGVMPLFQANVVAEESNVLRRAASLEHTQKSNLNENLLPNVDPNKLSTREQILADIKANFFKKPVPQKKANDDVPKKQVSQENTLNELDSKNINKSNFKQYGAKTLKIIKLLFEIGVVATFCYGPYAALRDFYYWIKGHPKNKLPELKIVYDKEACCYIKESTTTIECEDALIVIENDKCRFVPNKNNKEAFFKLDNIDISDLLNPPYVKPIWKNGEWKYFITREAINEINKMYKQHREEAEKEVEKTEELLQTLLAHNNTPTISHLSMSPPLLSPSYDDNPFEKCSEDENNSVHSQIIQKARNRSKSLALAQDVQKTIIHKRNKSSAPNGKQVIRFSREKSRLSHSNSSKSMALPSGNYIDLKPTYPPRGTSPVPILKSKSLSPKSLSPKSLSLKSLSLKSLTLSSKSINPKSVLSPKAVHPLPDD
ncbi:hypothetical protein FACS189465_1890 [Clostridia bacterium]|nr:hypothetical protein FACS189465_1890 [Clostridia bacterium]